MRKAGAARLAPCNVTVPARTPAPLLKTSMARTPDSKLSRLFLRELHDGLAQELAFIALQSRHLADTSKEPRAVELADAAQRALGEVRELIGSAATPEPGAIRGALARTAKRIARRCGAKVELDLDPRVEARPEARQDLLRILQEAMSNGARHGDADEFAVKLSCDSGLRLEIADNGTGFDTSRPRNGSSTRFGLVSMQERARELGGDLKVQSGPGAGTAVELLVP
jgi:signal transduction histidine kinase